MRSRQVLRIGLRSRSHCAEACCAINCYRSHPSGSIWGRENIISRENKERSCGFGFVCQSLSRACKTWKSQKCFSLGGFVKIAKSRRIMDHKSAESYRENRAKSFVLFSDFFRALKKLWCLISATISKLSSSQFLKFKTVSSRLAFSFNCHGSVTRSFANRVLRAPSHDPNLNSN